FGSAARNPESAEDFRRKFSAQPKGVSRMSRLPDVPSYRRHKQSGQAVVTLTDGLGGRRDVLLGKHGTAKSRKEDAGVLAEWSERPAPSHGGRRRHDDQRVDRRLLASRRETLPPGRRHQDPPAGQLQAVLAPPETSLRRQTDRNLGRTTTRTRCAETAGHGGEGLRREGAGRYRAGRSRSCRAPTQQEAP